MNFLEQLVSEWYAYRGFYVRENVRVGRRDKGGYEGELDVVAFRPESEEIVHVETSMDAYSWEKRREVFAEKFRKGKEYIPDRFPFADTVRQEAVFGYPRTTRDNERLGEEVTVYLMPELISEIETKLAESTVESGIVPENLPLLRAMQFALDYGGHLHDGS